MQDRYTSEFLLWKVNIFMRMAYFETFFVMEVFFLYCLTILGINKEEQTYISDSVLSCWVRDGGEVNLKLNPSFILCKVNIHI